ncbi:MAG: hypothetical protein QM775_32755 [Pirellulales bacterium]
MFRRALWGAVVVVLVAALAGFVTRHSWLPSARARLLVWLGAAEVAVEPDDHAGKDDHAGHDHAGHDDADSIKLSKQAQANIGLMLGKVELTKFERSITIPGIIVERPGRSVVAVTAPLTGIVTRIYPVQGEAVRAGQKLFDLQLTHEELVQGQGDFLRVAEELDVIENEIRRLEKIASEGGIPGRQVLERQYERQNKQAVMRATSGLAASRSDGRAGSEHLAHAHLVEGADRLRPAGRRTGRRGNPQVPLAPSGRRTL